MNNSCPYKPRRVITQKEAKKEKIGSFYHPTRETFRSGLCKCGMTHKKGYLRKAYTKKDGTFVEAKYIEPKCILNKGEKGKILDNYKGKKISIDDIKNNSTPNTTKNCNC